MNILCRVGWHDWTRWDKLGIQDIFIDKTPIGVQYIQSRICKRCEKHEIASTKVVAGEKTGA